MASDLNKLSIRELGQLFPIIIFDYNPEWKDMYQKEKQKILGTIGVDNIIRIEHIGSTAVPGLCSKPTIDILLEIMIGTNCDLLVKRLKKLHYQYIPKPENPPPHIMMAKGYSKNGITGQTFHLHVRYSGDWDEIIFRDYLIKNPSLAEQYVVMKRNLSKKFKTDREKYTSCKTNFVKVVVKKARNNQLK
ncbi:MAG: GrpB family protein [Bacteroidia bacterium]|nr:GrpB family protein [Bacteroidia bacterium]